MGKDQCPATADYYAKNVLVCAKLSAYLQMTNPQGAQQLADNLYGMCHGDDGYKACTHHEFGGGDRGDSTKNATRCGTRSARLPAH